MPPSSAFIYRHAMNSLVETVIAKVLTPYLEGISRENLRLGLFSGNLRMTDLKVNPQVLQDLHLPFATLESASVDLLAISIPWKNPIGGKIVIEVSGITVRVILEQSPSGPDKDRLLLIKRALIDHLKAQLAEAVKQPPITSDSFTAKLMRKIIDSLILRVARVSVSAVFPVRVTTDEEGFADASETVPDLEITVQVSSVVLEDAVETGDDFNPSSGILRKKAEIIGCVVQMGDVGDLAVVVPRIDLSVSVMHDVVNAVSRAHVRGLDEVTVSVTQSQLARLQEAILSLQVSDLSVIPPVEMPDDVRASYAVIYRQWTEQTPSAPPSAIGPDLENAWLLFDPPTVAKVEYSVDQTARPADHGRPKTWGETVKTFFTATTAAEPDLESYQAAILKQVTDAQELVFPTNLFVELHIGAAWTVRLGSLIDVELFGTHVVGAVEGLRATIQVTSGGIRISKNGSPLVHFITKQHGTGDSSPSAPGEAINPLEGTITISRETRASAAHIAVALKTQPLRISYEPGLMREAAEFFSFLIRDTVIESVQVQRERLMRTGMELLQSFQASPAWAPPRSIALDLDIAAPLLDLPTGTGERVCVSLGHIRVCQDKADLSGTTDTPPGAAVIEAFSVTAQTSRGESEQILAPSPIEVSAFFNAAENVVDVSVSMSNVLNCRLSPFSIATVGRLAEFFSSEMKALKPIQDLAERRESVDAEPYDYSSLTAKLRKPLIRIVGRIAKIDLMLADCTGDCLNVQVSVPVASVGVATDTGDVAASIENLRLVARYMNRRLGDWEPLLEPTSYTLLASVAGSLVNASVKSAGSNLVVTPDTVRLFERLARELVDCPKDAGDRFRVVNATSRTIQLHVPGSKYALIELLPSDTYAAIDALVLPHGARSIVLRLDEHHVEVPLERFQSTTLGEFLVHALMTDAAEYQTIVISHNAFVFNQCDVPFEISVDSGVPTPPCELLGVAVLDGPSVPREQTESGSSVLNPGHFVSVPVSALAQFQLRPLIGGDRPWAQPLRGIDEDHFTASVSGVQSGLFHMRIETKRNSELGIFQIHVRPPLVVANHLPFPIKLKHADDDKRSIIVTVPPVDSVAVYSCAASEDATLFQAKLGFLTNESDWSGVIGEVPFGRFLLSPDSREIAPVHLTIKCRDGRDIAIASQWRLVDRTGLGLSILDYATGNPFPRNDNVWLLPDPDAAVSVAIAIGRDRWELRLPDSGSDLGFVGRVPLAVISRESLTDKYVEIVPRFTFFNACEESVFVGSDLVAPNQGVPLLDVKSELQFRFLSSAEWSCQVPVSDTAAGVWPLRVGTKTCRLEISPLDGCIHFALRPGSTIVVKNRKTHADAVIQTDNGVSYTVHARTEVCIGWFDPFTSAAVETLMRIADGPEFVVPLARAGDKVWYGDSVTIDAGPDPQSIVILVHSRSLPEKRAPESVSVKIDAEIDRIGFSFVRNGLELVYAELSLIRAVVSSDADLVRIAAVVSDIQAETGASRQDKSPVILANTGEGSRPFVEFLVEISTNVSVGVAAVPTVSVQIDSLFVDVDSEFMEAVDATVDELLRKQSGVKPHASPALPDVVKGTIAPVETPTILILDMLEVSELNIELWVDFALKSMVFMPASLKLLIGMLSLGNSFKLTGAPVSVNRRQIAGFKGSSDQFVKALASDYLVEGIKNAARLLGSSSLLAIPRAPITLVTGVGAYGLDQASGAVNRLGEFMGSLTGDPQYKESQRKLRQAKKISGFADGMAEGVNRLGEGAEGMLDLFKKPVAGARESGFGGFLKGVGLGLMGTVIKPISKVGEAIGDVGSGIARTFAPSGESARNCYVRKRVPRAIYGPDKRIEEYREMDAVVYKLLPAAVGMEIVIQLLHSRCLVGFADRVLLIHLAVSPVDQTDVCRIEAEITPREIQGVERNFNVLVIRTVDAKERSIELTSDIAAAVAQVMGSGEAKFRWAPVKHVMSESLLDNEFAEEPVEQIQGASTTVEVLEVERFLMTYGWTTPYMLLDTDASWRWLDVNLHRHPRINGKLSRADAAHSGGEPPLTFGELWKPLDEWTIEKDESTTDSDGWMYALSFRSSTWHKSPGITASVRKRKWVRHIA